jgi:chemotaxis family two-component system response regulator PixG
MSKQLAGLLALAKAIATISHNQASGTLVVSHAPYLWQFEFVEGELACVTGNQHRVRRWRRALLSQQVDAVELTRGNPPISYNPWEYALLSRAVLAGRLDIRRAQNILASLALEAITLIASHPQARVTWQARASRLLDCAVAESGLSIPAARRQELLKEARDLQQGLPGNHPACQWLDHGLRLMANPEPCDNRQRTALSLQPLFNGRRTFWDIAIQLNQPMSFTTRMLAYFFSSETITFEPLDDFEPQPALTTAAKNTTERVPLVACIDDSLALLQRMEQIVTAAGYRFCGLRDSVQALTHLIELQPDVILLDVVMPVANGYEICAQIRRVKSLEQTPIVILTGRDGAFDRMRANKIVQASDFLSKASDNSRILEAVERQLHRSSAAAPDSVAAHQPMPSSMQPLSA